MKTAYRGIKIALGIFALLITTCRYNTTYAATPDAFAVEINPSSFAINEAVDLTIKAINAEGETIKDYVGDIFIEIEGIVDTADYTVPSEWLYTFLPEDQGVKLFSKGLTIKKSGTFVVKVSDPFMSSQEIEGKKTIIVGSTQDETAEQNITIISPIAWGKEKNSSINIMASAQWLPNAPYQIYINNIATTVWTTTANGDISAYINNTKEWDNTLQIKILNANNEIIGESAIISFGYEPIKDGVFKEISITPAGQIQQWQTVTFTLKTSESVTSTQIKISDGKSLPMDKSSPWVFSKEIFMDTKWTLTIDVDLIVLGQTKSYTGVATINIVEGIAIGKVRMYADSIDKTKLNVTREPIGTINQYRINYGTGETNLDRSATIQTKEIVIENLTVGETYYFQIIPLDASGIPVGTASEIIEAKIGENLQCVVVGIKVSTGQIGEKYYLMRSGVENVEKYIIYRSDSEYAESSQMQKIGETTGTMFEYPFNPNPSSHQYKYAYYLIEAACKDGTNLKIDNTKKLVVWPTENIMLIILISLFGYTMYKLYGYSKN